jgi:glycosyltransferase involved in cell wall biosynthesis
MSGTLQNPRQNIESIADELPDQALRVAIVARRLWPLAGEAERDVLELAGNLQQLGIRPTLITARWQKNWAEQTTLRGIPLTRLPWPATPGWGLLRYLYSLTRYLRQHRREFDAYIVQGLRAEAYATLVAINQPGTPVILRATEAGAYGEVAWQRQTRFGNRIAAKCRQATAIAAGSTFIADELRSANYPAARIQVLPPTTTAEHLPRSEETRESARKALANVNHDLHVVGGAPVAVCIAPLQRDRGLENAIRSWAPIQHKWPHARLWIIGDGPEREPLFRMICDLDLRYRVVIPGAFDHWEDLLQAADVLIAPAPQPSSSAVVRAGLAAGIPIVASDQAEHRDLLTSDKSGLFYASGERGAMTQCLIRLFDNAELRDQLGGAARATHEQRQETNESLWLRNLLTAERHVS